MTPRSQAPYPTVRLLAVIAITACGLIAFWTLVHMAAGMDEAIYRGGIIGLLAATAAHLIGTMVGALLAPTKGASAAYLASTLMRFVLTPALAVSLYFLLLMKPQPVLMGAAAGYLLILLADSATMLQAMRQHIGSPST
jgi:hypothetical protein